MEKPDAIVTLAAEGTITIPTKEYQELIKSDCLLTFILTIYENAKSWELEPVFKTIKSLKTKSEVEDA